MAEYNIKPKQRHINVAKKIAENSSKPLGAILKEEGYGKSTQKKPQRVTETKGYKMAERDILKQLEELEQDCVARMKKTVSEAPYGAVAINRKHLRDQIWEAKNRIDNNGKKVDEIIIRVE